MALAMATGQLDDMMPYNSQKKVPAVKIAYMDREIPDVSFVWMVLRACGKNDTVVPNAAT